MDGMCAKVWATRADRDDRLTPTGAASFLGFPVA